MDSLPTEEEEAVSGSARTRTGEEEEEEEEVRREEARTGRAATAATEQAGDDDDGDDGAAAIARAVGATLFEKSARVCFWIRFYSHVSAVVAPLLRMRDAEESKGACGGSTRGEKERKKTTTENSLPGGSRAESLKPAIFSFFFFHVQRFSHLPAPRRATSATSTYQRESIAISWGEKRGRRVALWWKALVLWRFVFHCFFFEDSLFFSEKRL